MSYSDKPSSKENNCLTISSKRGDVIHYSTSLCVLLSFLIGIVCIMLLKISCHLLPTSASSAHDWGLRVTFWGVWVTSVQFRADITGWLPRKKAKTQWALEICPVVEQVYLISESQRYFWSPPDLHAFIVIKAGVGIPRIGVLPCTRCFAPLWMSLKASCPLA